MGVYLGIDTSNYTTSMAICENGKIVANERIILDVAQGERGLRQSDALFEHINNLPEVAKLIGKRNVTAIGYSAFPRDEKGSYMPVFKAGECVARVLGEILGVPVYKFSHQKGHVVAAAYSADITGLLKGKINAFHVSGGTTEILLCDDLEISNIGKTLDLNAGQAIDRTGVLLGLKFPCGNELEKLALNGKMPEKPKICVKGLECNISGLENKVQNFLKNGCAKEDVARYAIEFISETLDALSENLRKKYDLPILYAGGVMRNSIIKEKLKSRSNTYFALPDYSSDNACGIALLAEMKGC